MQLKAIVSDYATVVHPSSRRRACSTSKRMPKQRHFYRIQVRSFFIEYRNHILSAWRDFDGDWADRLASMISAAAPSGWISFNPCASG